MSNFGSANEAGESFVNKIYTGVENFRVVAVCPSHEELKKIYNSDKIKEDNYIMTNDEGVAQAKIVLHLDNEAEEGEPSIKTRITFFVNKEEKLSQTGKKLYLNVFGTEAWLNLDGSVPDAMKWYDVEGKRPAFSGEQYVISFIRNLLNLPNPSNADKPEDAHSQFSEADWNGMFNGNFTPLKGAIMSSPNKIGLLLGAKTTDEGKIYQDVFNRAFLRQYAKASGKFDYLRKNVNDAQDNGAYSKTYFGNQDYILREYNADEKGATNDSLFTQEAEKPTTSFFSSETADNM